MTALTVMAALGTWAGAARASLVIAMDVDALTTQAERVVLGEVVAVSSKWDTKRERILTTVQVKVAEVWKGDIPTDGTVTLVQPGGTVGDIEMRVHGLPAFAVGETNVLFVHGTRQAALVGLGQGKRVIRLDPVKKQWMTEAADRSAAIVLQRDGRSVPAAAEPPITLDELRERVRAQAERVKR